MLIKLLYLLLITFTIVQLLKGVLKFSLPPKVALKVHDIFEKENQLNLQYNNKEMEFNDLQRRTSNLKLGSQINAKRDGKILKELHQCVFSNHLLIDKIFKNLSLPDILRCRQVSKLWLREFQHICKYFCTYRLTFYHGYVKVEEFLGLGSVRRKESEKYLNPLELQNVLREAIRIRINLLSIELEIRFGNLQSFVPILKEISGVVHVLDGTKCSVLQAFELLPLFPNLEVIKWGASEFTERDNILQKTKSLPLLKSVHKVVFGPFTGEERRDAYNLILDLTPNFTAIYQVPLSIAMDKIDSLQKYHTVRSLAPANEDDFIHVKVQKLPEYFQKLADLGVELVHAETPDLGRFYEKQPPPIDEPYDVRLNLTKKIKEEFYRLLKSSQNTLTTLAVTPAYHREYFIPAPFPLKSAKALRFKGRTKNVIGDFLSERADMTYMLPNLEEIHVNDGFGQIVSTRFSNQTLKIVKGKNFGESKYPHLEYVWY